jgi:glycosyltransferase involved in cell wall biosynthesis
LQSALGQTERNIEVLVCDDASADATLAVAGGFDDPRLRVVTHLDRRGIPGNWTRALALARGERVLLLLQDDVLAPDALAGLSSALDAIPGAVLAFGRREIRREAATGPAAFLLGGRYPALQEQFYASMDGPLEGVALVRGALRAGRDLTVNVIGEPSFVLMRAQAVRDVGSFDARLRQLVDWDLWLRLAARGPVCFVDRTVGSFRLHAASQSARTHGTPRVPWEYVQVLSRVLREYGHALGVEERREITAARWRYRRHIVGETIRYCLRGASIASPDA